MAGKGNYRRIVDAVDDLAREVRVANAIAALRLGSAALDEDPGVRATTSTAKARVARANELRARVRDGLGVQ